MYPDLQIICPTCGNVAGFTYARSIDVKKTDIDYFYKSKIFNVKKTQGWSAHRTIYYVVHYPYLMPALDNITDLPEDYPVEKWMKRRAHGMDQDNYKRGVVACSFCKSRQKHVLDWPEDAFFKIEFKGQPLWAYDREYAVKLREYIASTDRKKRHPSSTEEFIFQDAFLRKIPEQFQSRKAREEIIKKLDKLLS